MKTLLSFVGLLLIFGSTSAHAIEVRVTAPAIERTLRHQLFNQADPDGKLDRHYLKGNGTRGCSVYADEPHVSFRDDRVVVDVRIHARLGFGKACIGISVATQSEVSFVPEAEGESIGFRDAHVDHLTDNRDLDALLEPFLSTKLPQEMKVNAADLMRNLLVKAPDSTGYKLTLETLALHSMQVTGDVLVVDLDANFLVE
jgi:hypothetical protein